MTGLVRTSANALTRSARTVSKGGKKITKATIPNEIEFGAADKLDSFTKSTQKKSNQIRLGPKSLAPAAEPVIPLPDEEALKQARRRTRSRRAGARASTVLSGGDSDTVG